MANAKVFCPTIDIASPLPPVVGGYAMAFPVIYHGPDVPEGRVFLEAIVAFQDGDTATQMEAKVRDAVIAAAAPFGFSVAVNAVVSLAPPKRL